MNFFVALMFLNPGLVTTNPDTCQCLSWRLEPRPTGRFAAAALACRQPSLSRVLGVTVGVVWQLCVD